MFLFILVLFLIWLSMQVFGFFGSHIAQVVLEIASLQVC
jgi:hypothetical protein